MARNDGTHFGGCLSLSGSIGHAPLKHADRFGAIVPKRSFSFMERCIDTPKT